MKILFINIIMLLFLAGIYGKQTLPLMQYKFDAGYKGDKIEEGLIYLTKENIYNEETGYGWIVKPNYDFAQDRLSKYRNDFTIDGVTGKKLSFKVDLPAGEWWITIWLESGFEDSTTAQIKLNGDEQELNWQIFTPPNEPRNEIQRTYRIFSGNFNTANNNLQIDMESSLDSVRLLGFSLIPKPNKLSSKDKELFNELAAAGKYNSGKDLKKDREKIITLLTENPGNSFALHYKEQIDLMIEAEDLYNMLGWEWAAEKTGMGLFDRFPQVVMILDAIVNQKDSPFYERALWLRSKLLYWLDIERGIKYEKITGSKGFKELYSLFPDDKILAMYNGKKVDMPDYCDSIKYPANAPLWSKLQYESLCRLKQEIAWWVNVKQAENGEFGGKLGDDVEILRGWSPAALSGDKTVLKGWKKLAECVWNSPVVYKGYSSKIFDVEHSSEFISDSAPELVFYSDEDKYLERLKFSARYFGDLWTGISDNGKRYFKSTWFSSTEVDTTPPKNRDVEMNTRAVKAVRYYAWKTGDRKIIELLHQWSLGWEEAAMKNEKGKPAGIIPASIVFPSAEINDKENNWYNPGMYWEYYDWQQSAGSKMYDQLLFTYLLTDDSTLLQPLIYSLKLIQKYENTSHNSDIKKIGSEVWVDSVLKSKSEYWNIVGLYRFATLDNKFDNLILKHGTPYSKYRLTGNIALLEKELERYLENIRYNSPLRTSEALHTDRVYYLGGETIKAMLSGDGTYEGTSPYAYVSWEETTNYLTALVEDAGTEKLIVQLFSYSPEEQQITMRVWRLKKGKYVLELNYENGKIKTINTEIHKTGERIKIKIPSKELVTINLKPKKN